MILDGVARHLGSRPGKGRDLIGLSVGFQARAIGAKAIGKYSIAAGGQERGVRGAHRLAARHVTNLRTVPGDQTLCDKTGAETAGGQTGHQDRPSPSPLPPAAACAAGDSRPRPRA